MNIISAVAIIAVIVIAALMVVLSVPWWGSGGFARLAPSPAGRTDPPPGSKAGKKG